MRSATYRSILFASALGTMHGMAFISSVLSLMIANSIKDPLLVAALLVAKRVSRIVFDVPTGIMGDKIGSKYLFLLSMLATAAASTLLLFHHSWQFLAAVLLLKGLSDSCVNGKVESHIYSALEEEGKINLFGKFVSAYYLFAEVSIAITLWLVSGFPHTKQMIACGICVSVAGFVLGLFMKNNSMAWQSIRPPLKEIVASLAGACRQNKTRLMLMLWGMCSFLGWQLNSITSIVMTGFGFGASEMVKMQSLEHLALGTGCIISIAVSDKIDIKKAIVILFLSCLAMLICALTQNPIIIVASVVLYLGTFCTLEIVFEKAFGQISTTSNRLSVSSVATTITAIYNVAMTMLFGLIAKYFGYQYGWIILCLIIVLYIAPFLVYRFYGSGSKMSP